MKLVSMFVAAAAALLLGGSTVKADRIQIANYEGEWLKQVGALKTTAEEQKLTIGVATADGGGEAGSPAASSFYIHKTTGAKFCVITITVRNNPLAVVLFERTPKDQRELALKAILMHELGHCAQFVHDTDRVMSVTEMRKEAYADVYSIALMSKLSDIEFSKVLSFFIWFRVKVGEPPKDPVQKNSYDRYDTLPYILRAIEIRELAKQYPPEKVAAYIVYEEKL